jgi:hypothetical protein
MKNEGKNDSLTERLLEDPDWRFSVQGVLENIWSKRGSDKSIRNIPQLW